MLLPLEYIIYLGIILAGFLIGVIYLKKNKKIKPIIILLAVTFVCECMSRVLAYQIRNSNPAYHFLNPLQSALWGVFFFNQFKTAYKKRVSLLMTTLLILFSFLNTIFFQDIFTFPDNILKIQSFILIALGFTLFFEKTEEISEINIFTDPVFLAIVALIWFNLISFIFFNFHRFLIENLLSKTTFRLINYISNYVYYLTLLVAVVISACKRENNES